MNQDASVIAGAHAFRYTTDPVIVERIGVIRWTPAGGEFLTNAIGNPIEGNGIDTSSDGGTILILNGSNVSRWTQAAGLQVASGLLYNLDFAVPRISGDGSTIISSDKMWTQGRGALPITQVLTEAGCTFPGWTNLVATGIDFNATHLCGYATNPTGQTEAWYATIPAPGLTAFLTLAIARATRRRR